MCTTLRSWKTAFGAISKLTAHKLIIMALRLGLQEPRNTWRWTSVVGFVPSTVSVSQTKMSPISTSPDLDQGHPNSCFVTMLLPQYAPEVRNLEDIGCLAFCRLLTGQEDRATSETLLKALSLAAWVEDHHTHKHS